MYVHPQRKLAIYSTGEGSKKPCKHSALPWDSAQLINMAKSSYFDKVHSSCGQPLMHAVALHSWGELMTT